jgi:hypothetical protein
MKAKQLREFALDCLKAARQTGQTTDQDSYRAIAERLIRRANEVDQAAAPANTPARMPKLQRS